MKQRYHYFDFTLSALSKARNGPTILLRCQTTNKSQVFGFPDGN